MRVLWLTNMWPDEQRPWYGSFIHTQAQSLQRIGVDLDVLYVPGYRSSREYGRGAREVLRRTRRERYDVVHAHYGHSGVLARLQLRAPVLLSYCGDDLLGTPREDGASLTPASIALSRSFAALSYLLAATITKSEEMERRLPRHVRPRNHVIPNGVDLAQFSPIPKAQARERLGWAEPTRTLLFVGNPSIPRKNLPLAEAVLDELRARGRDVELRVAWGIEPSAIPVWMAASDVLVFPSFAEGSPNTVKEAMAMELPIVSAEVGDVSERLRGIDGAFVAPREPVAMANLVERALAFDRLPQAREAVSQLSLQRVAERVARLYESLASRTRR